MGKIDDWGQIDGVVIQLVSKFNFSVFKLDTMLDVPVR